MRLVCAAMLATLSVHAAPAVTLVLQFDEAYSTQSVDAMKREVASIVGESGLTVDWRMRQDVQVSDSFEKIVVVRFHGACAMEQIPQYPDERGYYAFTHVSDGEVLSFSEVECDKVSNSIRPAMSRAQWKQRDSILGRALGRVLAHELFHMLAKSEHHAGEGVTRSALSPAQLVAGRLRMSRADLESLKK